MKVFISRNLSSDSIFLGLLNSVGIEVEGKSLVEFQPVDFIFDNNTDWIFFYSKTGVEFFFKKILPEKIIDIKIAAIGTSTALMLEKMTNRTVDFIGDGHPESTANKFLRFAEGRRVNFIRAANSRQSVQKILEEKIITKELIVYQNDIIKTIHQTNAEILVFTSPLNVQAYFTKYNYQAGMKIISIGTTTREALYAFGINNVVTVETATEKKLAEAVILLAV